MSVAFSLTPCVPDGVLGDNATAPFPLPGAEAFIVACRQEVKNVVSRCVEGKGHQERVEEVHTQEAQVSQPVQQPVHRSMPNLVKKLIMYKIYIHVQELVP